MLIIIFFQLSWVDLFFVAILDHLNFMAKIDLLEGRLKVTPTYEQTYYYL